MNKKTLKLIEAPTSNASIGIISKTIGISAITDNDMNFGEDIQNKNNFKLDEVINLINKDLTSLINERCNFDLTYVDND